MTKARTRKSGQSVSPPDPSAEGRVTPVPGDGDGRASMPPASGSPKRLARRSKTPPPPAAEAAERPSSADLQDKRRARRSRTPVPPSLGNLPPASDVTPPPPGRIPLELSPTPPPPAPPQVARAEDSAEPRAGRESGHDKAQTDAVTAKVAVLNDEHEVSVPPASDLDDRFFATHDHHHHDDHDDDHHHEVDGRAAHKMTAAAIKRRAQLAKYVKALVGIAALLCLVALVQAAIAKRRPQADPQAIAPAVATLGTSAANSQPTEEPRAVTPPAPAPEPVKPAESASEPAASPAASAAPEPAPSASAAPSAAPETDPKAAKEQKLRAKQFLERGKAAEAIEAADRAVALDPSDAESWLVLGAAYQEKGNVKEARRCYSECVKQGKGGFRGECAAMLR